ncbi:MAG: helix-turn-helix transcriptional regulator [Planctomycetaceae bacterium]|nr:helix-turn-helix transcriptional regulator [Planctomycetaceae bacterium]
MLSPVSIPNQREFTMPPAPNILDQGCPAQQALATIADKWAAIIVYALASGTKRFGELQRSIGGVSQKMLTQTLRNLERDGLVERTVFPVVPPRVEYRLTPLGNTLREPLSALCHWAEQHMGEVQAARARYAQHEPVETEAEAAQSAPIHGESPMNRPRGR